jgi:hypothetical protein
VGEGFGLIDDADDLINELFSDILNILLHLGPIVNGDILADHHALRDEL